MEKGWWVKGGRDARDPCAGRERRLSCLWGGQSHLLWCDVGGQQEIKWEGYQELCRGDLESPAWQCGHRLGLGTPKGRQLGSGSWFPLPLRCKVWTAAGALGAPVYLQAGWASLGLVLPKAGSDAPHQI